MQHVLEQEHAVWLTFTVKYMLLGFFLSRSVAQWTHQQTSGHCFSPLPASGTEVRASVCQRYVADEAALFISWESAWGGGGGSDGWIDFLPRERTIVFCNRVQTSVRKGGLCYVRQKRSVKDICHLEYLFLFLAHDVKKLSVCTAWLLSVTKTLTRDFLGCCQFDQINVKCQTWQDGRTCWALPVHTTF